MNYVVTDNAKTELVSLVETTYGEAILTMQRGEEEKELVASVIPVDICQNRITAEIERLLTLEKKVKSLS